MTKSEAIKELRNIRPKGGIIPQRRAEAIDIAIKALEKEEKYHWHDLRKNPEDLPSGRNMCTCFAEGDFVIEDGSVVRGKYPVIIPFPFSEYEYRYNFKVVAWREIEPFEREVEE